MQLPKFSPKLVSCVSPVKFDQMGDASASCRVSKAFAFLL